MVREHREQEGGVVVLQHLGEVEVVEVLLPRVEEGEVVDHMGQVELAEVEDKHLVVVVVEGVLEPGLIL